MSNTHSSHLSSSDTARCAAVRKLVMERAGRQWCLFVDRDGVINRRIAGDYVRRWSDFEWLRRAPLALERLREWAPQLVVVTNQQGIGKGLVTRKDLEDIHQKLQLELAEYGVKIDAIQVCPHLQSLGCACRKPKPGLILDWLKRCPNIDQSLSVMVGDSQSDIELAHQVAAETGGCASIRIGRCTSRGAAADASFQSLWEFAAAVECARDDQGHNRAGLD
ncbi:MAG: HAD family hydrolase [Mycolicibacterium sp.]|nr:HAD family hydrolase [Mycolicibacterium sp.]